MSVNGAPAAVRRAPTDPRRPILIQPNPEDLGKLSEVLDLDTEQLKSSFRDHHMVHRGETWTWPPKVGSKDWARENKSGTDILTGKWQDPVLYRLYEVLVVYGVGPICSSEPTNRRLTLSCLRPVLLQSAYR